MAEHLSTSADSVTPREAEGRGKSIVLDLFAGPGGWDVAASALGLRPIGIEKDAAACATRAAAGHLTIRADVATYPTAPFAGKVWGLIASPPCQAWSMAGKRKGELDRPRCYQLVSRFAAGAYNTDWTEWEDPRSPLVAEPLRWAQELHPEWIALEQVPPVIDLWRHIARYLARHGYETWTGILNAADYGVPQTRERAFLIAHRTAAVAPPEPTHAQDGGHADLFGPGRLPWVTMAQALGWAEGDLIRPARGEGMCERHGERPDHPADEPAPTVISKARSWTRFVSAGVTGEGRPKDPTTQPADTITGKGTAYWLRAGAQKNATVRTTDEPAPTILASMDNGDTRWFFDRPATTVVGSFNPDVISPPGYRTSVSRQNAEGGVRVTVAEGGVLQSFPPDYPWQGSRSKQYEQVGNAVPPLLAAHVLSAVTGLPMSQEVAA